MNWITHIAQLTGEHHWQVYWGQFRPHALKCTYDFPPNEGLIEVKNNDGLTTGRLGPSDISLYTRLTFQSWSSYQLNQLGSKTASDSTLKQLTTCRVSNTCTLLSWQVESTKYMPTVILVRPFFIKYQPHQPQPDVSFHNLILFILQKRKQTHPELLRFEFQRTNGTKL